MITPHDLVSIPEDCLSEIGFEITECTEAAIELHFKRKVIEFCEQSHFWHEIAAPALVEAGVFSYPVVLPVGLEVVSVIAVHWDGGELKRCSTDDVKYRFWQERPGHIDLPEIDELIGKTLSIRVSVRPAQDDPFMFSAELLRDYRSALVAGTKAALYITPRKQWTDPGQAQVNDSIFRTMVGDAQRYQGRGYSRMPDRAIAKRRDFY